MSLSKFLRQIKNNDWVGEWLDQQLFREGDQQATNSPPVLSIRPSSSGGSCVRSIQLSMLGFREKMKPQNLRRTRNGTAAHDRWNAEFKAAGILVAANVKLKVPEIHWSGECDVIVRNPVTNENHILEIKTMNSNRYRKIPEQAADYEEMAKSLLYVEKPYVYQLMQYIEIFKNTEYKTTDTAIFLFENTDTQEYKIRYLKPSEAMKKEAFRLPLEAQDWLKKGILIDPPFARTSQTCRLCYKETLCYKLQDGDPEATKKVEEALALVKED